MGEYTECNVTKEDVLEGMQVLSKESAAKHFFAARVGEPFGNLLDQAAEEAAELAQACIKYKRAIGLSCPTQCSPEKALDNLLEEYADVMICMETLKRAMERKNEGHPVVPLQKFKEKVQEWTHYKYIRFLLRYHNL